jgi:hypothetical protein
MRKLLVLGLCIVLGTEVLAMLQPDRRFVLWTTGTAVALVLLVVRRFLAQGGDPGPAEPGRNDPEESLRRWLTRTETLIRWSESTRSDWDRHLRPRLAREFGMATGQRQAKDPAAFRATGEMLFGTELWGWVDPGNIAQTGGREPGPGRRALNEILHRLEQV